MTMKKPNQSARNCYFSHSFCAALLALLSSSGVAQTNPTMMQYFDWDTPADGEHWNRLREAAPTLAAKGITSFWLPPAYKGAYGNTDVGYGVYDLYDLGEFEQKGSVGTKYGKRDQYLAAIDAIHAAGAYAYADIVLNHKMGGDATQRFGATRVEPSNRNTAFGGDIDIDAWVNFTFPGRVQADGTHKYSNFAWQWYHFDGVDYANNLGADGCATVPCRIYKVRGEGKEWDPEVSTEYGSYDYLMANDIDFQHPEVREHLKEWGVWYTNTARLDGFRIDAAKHIQASFFNDWLYHVRQATGKLQAFAVSEYWDWDLGRLTDYVNRVNDNGNNALSVFDVPLHYRFFDAGNGQGGYDMRSLTSNTLVATQPLRAVTFVDNHDTLNGRGLASQVADWFKPQAYAFILLRATGYPKVFLGDYEGVAGKVANHGWVIDQMLTARKFHAYGIQYDYFDHGDVVGWTRIGDDTHHYGLAVVMNDSQTSAGSKRMFVGAAHGGQCFQDISGAELTQVCADADGWATFTAPPAKATVWVRSGRFGTST